MFPRSPEFQVQKTVGMTRIALAGDSMWNSHVLNGSLNRNDSVQFRLNSVSILGFSLPLLAEPLGKSVSLE